MTERISNQRTFHTSTLLEGLAAYSAPACQVVSILAGDEIISCPELYGGFVVRRHSAGDPPYTVDETYRRPLPATTRRPDGIQPDEPGAGFTRLDRALSAAADLYHGSQYPWSSTERRVQSRVRCGDQGGVRWDPSELGLSPVEVSDLVKGAARLLGASQAGIAPLDQRWFYAAEPRRSRTDSTRAMAEIRFSDDAEAPEILPDGAKRIPTLMRYAVVMAFEMAADLGPRFGAK